MLFQPTNIRISDTRTIILTFSSAPSIFLTPENFNIASTSSGVSDLAILSVDVSGKTITLNTRPQFPLNLYLIQLLDTTSQSFEDTNNIELSTATNDRNIYFIGVDDNNTIRDNMLSSLPPIYDIQDQTLAYDTIATTANEINEALITLNEVKNDNFISISVVDELYYRGSAPTDRLKNENAYSIDRVARTTTGTNAAGKKSYDPTIDTNIPFEVLNLRVIQTKETIPNGVSTNGFSGFLLTLQKANITKLISAVLNNTTAYDPTKYGYALLNNEYDRNASKLLSLQSNQILLSSLTNGAFPSPTPGDMLNVVYEYDSVGRRVDGSSVSLFSVLQSTNERVPAGVSSFYLEFANIVNNSGNVVIVGGVRFQVSPINLSIHPAFLREIAFNMDSLPNAPGEYTINYSTGQVFVFGVSNQLGTGTTPPVATYYYKDIAINNTDYFISDDGYNITLNYLSLFASQPFVITFLYEDVFTPAIDYDPASHIEVLNERVNNRLVSDFTITANNSPVKEVYQILNETTGESYTPGLIDGDLIYFTGNNPPATSQTLGEIANIAFIDSEVLNVVMPTTTPNGLLKLFPIPLSQHPVMNSRFDGVGSSFNSSILFTRDDLFLNELYFNPNSSVQLNIGKLLNIGDYCVDYNNGQIYLGVSSGQTIDVGQISYAYGAFIPVHPHILGVSSIGLGTTSTNIIQEYDVGIIKDGLIVPKSLNYGYDSFNEELVPNSNSIFIAQLQDDFTLYTKYPIKKVVSVFTQNDVDAYGAATVDGYNLFNPLINSFNDTLIDLKTYITLPLAADTNSNYNSVIIPDDTTVVKSILVLDTNTQLLDTQLNVIVEKDIIIKSVVLNSPTSATAVLQNILSITEPTLDSLVDIAGKRFDITNISGGNTLTLTTSASLLPVVNSGSQILDNNGILVADHLAIISATELPDMAYVVHYATLPVGVLVGWQIKDTNNNTFTITAVQSSSVVVQASATITPIITPTARIETQSILTSIGSGMTKLLIPLDAAVSIGMNIQIGYIPTSLNNRILAAESNVLSAGGSGMVIDYAAGQFFLNYTHLDDELLVSYDYGDNEIDWSISDVLSENDPYFVSYKYGASRNGLETNFAPLTQIDFLQTAPLSISRETYRTAVGAAIKSFLKGATHEAVRLLCHSFTQIDPDIEEAILNQWLIGRDPLSLQAPTSTGQIVFGNGKYGEGHLITGNNSIQLPGASSLRLAQGTFSTWFRPNWNGDQADEYTNFTLPTQPINVFYNAYDKLPQQVQDSPWFLDYLADGYGNAYLYNGFLETRNSKNRYTSAHSTNPTDGYILNGDSYSYSSGLNIHTPFTSSPYSRVIGTYTWEREEPTLSVVNDLDVSFAGYVSDLFYVNPNATSAEVANIGIDDGYGSYSTGFYLFKRGLYSAEVIEEDNHLSVEPPFPRLSPPIKVSTIFGSASVMVVDGDTSTLSIGQTITIGSAYPIPTNIIGISTNSILMRSAAATSLTTVNIDNLDPISTPGTQDGYGELYLEDELGTRKAGTTDIRTGGWNRQLLIQLQLTPFSTSHLMIIGSHGTPLSTQTPATNFLSSIEAGVDVLVDSAGNVFEIDSVQLPYVWLKKPTSSGVSIPVGVLTAFRKVVGIKLPDQVLVSAPINFSILTSYSFEKVNGSITLTTTNSNVVNTITASYIQHANNNTTRTNSISFGQFDIDVDAKVKTSQVSYSIHSIFDESDVYVGNVGSHPITTELPFKYDVSSVGVPAISTNKYFAIFTSPQDAYTNESPDEVFVKLKVPSSWVLSDGTNTKTFSVQPICSFSSTTTGDLIDVVDAYGMTYEQTTSGITYTAQDTSTYTNQLSILDIASPELRIAVGKQHFILDTKTPQGSLQLFRSGNGYLTAQVSNNAAIFNIRSDISSWIAGQLYFIAMSWKINSPDENDELHLFINGDEVPNEIMFGDSVDGGVVGSIYEETLTPIFRIASTDGYITNNGNGSGVLIPTAASIQPDNSWLNRTLVINSTSLGGGIYLNEPLIVSALISVVGGTLILVSQNGVQIDFSVYGSSTPVLYGLATSSTAILTSLIFSNFGVFKNNVELNSPASTSPQFRQVTNSQVVEFYSVDSTTGEYIEDITSGDTITIRTYGLLTQKITAATYQYGNMIRTTPLIVDTDGVDEVMIGSGSSAFITDLQVAPVNATSVSITKTLLPRVMI